MAKGVLIGVGLEGAIRGIISTITGGPFWEGYFYGAFYGAIGGLIGGGMGFIFTGALKGLMTLGQILLTGGVSGIGSILLGDLGDIVIKGEEMSLKKIVIDVVVAGVTGVAFAGIAYGLSKAFAALKLKMFSKGGSVPKSPSEVAQSWQGSDKYPRVDTYKDIMLKEGKVIYRGEPNGSEYFTTKSAIERFGRDATKIFEGLQVEKNPIHVIAEICRGIR